MVAVMSERKWRFVPQLLFVFEVCISMCVVVNDSESEIVEWVRRRQSGDFYHFINLNLTIDNCGNENSIYLISENQCVKDQELYRGNIAQSNKPSTLHINSGCSHALVPAQPPNLTMIAVFDSPLTSRVTYLS